MQHHRNGGSTPASLRRAVPPPPVDRVCGLGLCDVLRIEIDNCQVEPLREETDELRRVIDEAIGVALEREDRGDLQRLEYEREALDMIRRQLVNGLESERSVVVGPAAAISELVGGAARDAGEQLVAHLDNRRLPDTASAEALVAAAELAGAWARTYAPLSAVETYSFDPAFDPPHR